MGDRRDESSGAGGGARAQRKKQRRGAAAQQQQRQQGLFHGRGQKNRQQWRQQESAGPSATFLAALEEQRENERRRQELQSQQQQQERADELVDGAEQSRTSALSEQRHQRQAQRQATGAIAGSAPPAAPPAAQRKPAHIAGFYYDEVQKRYFKLTPQMKQRVKQSKQQRDAKERDAAAKKALQARRERHSAAGARSTLRGNRGWVGCIAERESSFAWGVGRRDQREMMPRLFTSTMATQELRPVHVDVFESRRRITALDFCRIGDYAAMGFSGGRLDIAHIGVHEDLRSGFARQGEREIRVAEQVDVGASYQISALKWRPGDPFENAHHLLYACVGGDPFSSSLATAASHSRGHNTGFVCLFKINNSIEDTAQKWLFNDPWSIEWNPRHPGRFVVGLSGPICAAYVDVEVRNEVTNAPKGKIKSDVMAQAFSNDGNTIFNGTRNGSTWLWDLRASRRAQEHGVVPAAASQAAGSIVDLHVLKDDFQALVQKSNGELRLVDTRKNAAVVVEFGPGRENSYLPMLKCAVNDSETVVVAAGWDGESTVCSYQMSSGKILSQVAVNKAQLSKAATPPLEQVHLRVRDSGRSPLERDTVLPEVWALSRNALFVCDDKEQTK